MKTESYVRKIVIDVMNCGKLTLKAKKLGFKEVLSSEGKFVGVTYNKRKVKERLNNL